MTTEPGPRRPLPQQRPAPTPPPFPLLVAHFSLLGVSLLLGSLGLVVAAPQLGARNFLHPHVLAVVHLFTLGVLLATISGVLHQFYPMALGWRLRSVRVAGAGVTMLIAGVSAVVAGFWFWVPALLGIGWLLIFGAVGCVSWNLLPARRRLPQARLVGGYVSAGHVALGFALLLAAGRIGEFLHWWSIDRLGTIAAHYHFAALGFGTLTAVGVGSRMLPMFLVAHGAPTRPVPWIGPLVAIGILIFGVGAPLHIAPLVWVGASFMCAGALLHVTVARWYFQHRLRRRLDVALRFVAVAFVNLSLAVLVGAVLLLLPGFHPGLWIAYATLGILGWLVTLIMGILQKLVPHLGRMRLFTRDGRPIPEVDKLLLPAVGRVALVSAEAGVLILAGAGIAGRPALAQVGAALWLTAVLLTVGQFGRIVWMAKRP